MTRLMALACPTDRSSDYLRRRSVILPKSGRLAARCMHLMTREVAMVKSKCVVQSLDASSPCVQNLRQLLNFRNDETRERPILLMRKVGPK